MTGHGNGSPFYKVTSSGAVNETIIRLHEQAAKAGRGKEFLAALRQIYERLRRDPMVFGEPLFRLPALKLQIRQGGISFVVVDYGVHEELLTVFVRVFKVLS